MLSEGLLEGLLSTFLLFDCLLSMFLAGSSISIFLGGWWLLWPTTPALPEFEVSCREGAKSETRVRGVLEPILKLTKRYNE